MCTHADVERIDADLSRGVKARKAIAYQYRISEGAISRHVKHRQRAAGEIVRGSSTTSSEAAVHRKVNAILSGAALISEIATLRRRADALCTQAEASKDARTALLAIRELTRLLELQGRLALEAQAGRASDVSSHPVWMSLSSDIMSALAPYPEAAMAVAQRIRSRLGVSPPVEVQAQDVPFPLGGG